MNKPHLNIRIAGHIGTGKTTLLRALVDLLKEYDIEAETEDADDGEVFAGTVELRLKALKMRGLQVKIQTIPLRASLVGLEEVGQP